jgi:uncharacterized RDD family membrane protein YckC
MENWKTFKEIVPAADPESVSVPESTDKAQVLSSVSEPVKTAEYGDAICSECGNLFSKDSMIRHGNMWICAACKPTFVQKLKEGVPVTGEFVYGGFWIRFCAKFVDGIIQYILQFIVGFFVGALFSSDNIAALFFLQGIQIIIAAAYTTYFLGKFGATPGKMAFKLKVIRPDGEAITYARALGRHFAEILSGLILMIGYIMAAFDDEKRTLHDRICDTRVVKQ